MKYLAVVVFLLTAASAAIGADAAPASSAADQLRGNWRGPWTGQRSNGQMEVEIQPAENDAVTGRVRVTYGGRTNCSTGWENLAGTRSAEKVNVHYDLGGSCGKVNATFALNSDGTAIGSWTNQYGRGGTLSLIKR